MQNHLSKPEDLMLQNATPLRKSAPGPPNSSDEHVSCTAPATGNPSFQILLFKCPTPAIVFGNARKPSRFAHFWQGAQSLAPATQNNASTSTSGAYMWRFVDVGFEMCFAPQRRALFRHLNFKKCSEPLSFLPFWLRNVLRATTACTFSTSQFPKVVRAWCVCTFWLGNVIRAPTACNFSSLIWPAGSAALASLLFDPPEPQIIGKTQCFATFLPFRASASSFFWLFLFYSSLFYIIFLFSLTLSISAFHLSILSEDWLLNFLRSYIYQERSLLISQDPSHVDVLLELSTGQVG